MPCRVVLLTDRKDIDATLPVVFSHVFDPNSPAASLPCSDLIEETAYDQAQLLRFLFQVDTAAVTAPPSASAADSPMSRGGGSMITMDSDLMADSGDGLSFDVDALLAHKGGADDTAGMSMVDLLTPWGATSSAPKV